MYVDRQARTRPARRKRAGSVTLVALGVTGLIVSQLGAAGRAAAKALPAVAPANVAAGTAFADATVLGVVPQTAGLSLTTAAGQANSAYNQTEAQADSSTLNLGGLGVLLANSPFCGHIAYPESSQPQPLTADTGTGASSQTTKGNVPGAGTESVTVSSDPEFASATTRPVTQSLPGVIDITGTATSAVRYVAGQEQEADSSVTEDVSLINGLIRITGMSWSASQHSGRVAFSHATFDFGTVSISTFGIPVRLPGTASASTVVDALNAVLGVFGFTIVLPIESRNPATHADSIGPLQLHFSGSPLDNKLTAPTASAVVALENLLAKNSSNGSNCADIKNLIGNISNPANAVINVELGAMEGSGAIDLDLGGASAGTQPAPNFVNPFGSGFPPPAPTPLPPAGVTPATGQSGGAVSSVPAAAANPITSAIPTPAAATTPATRSAPEAAVPAAVRCVTTSQAGGNCWRGLGELAAGVAIALGAALLVADVRQSRRARPRRRAPA